VTCRDIFVNILVVVWRDHEYYRCYCEFVKLTTLLGVSNHILLCQIFFILI